MRTVSHIGRLLTLLIVATLVASVAANTPRTLSQPGAATLAQPAATAGGFLFYKFPSGQPLCTGLGLNVSGNPDFSRDDCGFVNFTSSAPTTATLLAALLDPISGTPFYSDTAVYDSTDGTWQVSITPDDGGTWPAGVIRLHIVLNGAVIGGSAFNHNLLGASVTVAPRSGGGRYRPGEALPISGTIFRRDTLGAASTSDSAPGAQFRLALVRPDGSEVLLPGTFTAANDGSFSTTIPGSATSGISASQSGNYLTTVSLEVRDASYSNLTSGNWAARRAGAGSATLFAPPTTPTIENSFVSSVGWVKPGEGYTFRVFVRNYTSTNYSGVGATIPAPDGTRFTQVQPLGGGGASISSSTGQISWQIGTLGPAAADGTPALRTLIVQARADTLQEDFQIVWKNLSSTATLTYSGKPAGLTLASTSHGPKVIPESKSYNTARYGDRPFPVVPVDYFERKHEQGHTGDQISTVINSPSYAGSTFNLFQEMSFGQLYPNGTVPSSNIASASFDDFNNDKFTDLQPSGTCKGNTWKDLAGSGVYAERIVDGWYQLPGDTEYYGGDKYGSGLVGALTGVGAIFDVDGACGPTGKAVYDAAAIADPEIDYSDYDTDKDGVVDFFMMIFVGLGGNGDSQINGLPPYDNIWPHSSSLEFYYTDANGQKGYVSDDQLKDYMGRPLFWTDSSRTQMTTSSTSGLQVKVRVGPYNVNPESAIDNASVISHEYGHSLGLPDFYTLGSDRETYGSWNLMASDHSQHMDIFSKQELGWIVPKVLDPGEAITVTMVDSKTDIGAIEWVDALGSPYTLSGPGVHNGDAYVAKLPARELIDPAKVERGASPTHLWWSEAGNDFGCPPTGGHNLDIYLPGMADVVTGTQTTLTFRSLFEIEWDYDYGFVMVSTDGGETYQSLPSNAGTTTPQGQNPNANGCQAQYGNGITGSSSSYISSTQVVDRVAGLYPDPEFLTDTFTLPAAAAGKDNVVLRFSYATDPGLAKRGWFIDDVRVTAGNQVLFASDFEESGDPEDPQVFNGGCKDRLSVAAQCTSGWQYIDTASGSPADHAYYLEMRDRSGFDLDGKGQSDRGDPTWAPGLLLVYTDEAHGYGNAGTDDPPAQSPLDSQPQPNENIPNLDDAAFTADTASNDHRFSDWDAGWFDNYQDPRNDNGDKQPGDTRWLFKYDCLSFDVLSMSGNSNGPASLPGDLMGSVRFRMGTGCAPFDYGGIALDNVIRLPYIRQR